jgi:Xaa-Pro aminopeptidase
MLTIQPALKNGRNVWDPINMPPIEFQQRIHRVREKMGQQDIDVLLAYGNAFNDYGNYTYFSNYVIRLPRGVLVAIPKEGDTVLFFEGAGRGLPSAKMLTWIEDVRPCPDVSKQCAVFLKEKGFIPGTIGFAGLKRLMPYAQWKHLNEILSGCKIIEFVDIIRDMRMLKTHREIDQIRRASRIVKRCFARLTEGSFTDMNERSLEAMIIREARLDGAEDVRVLVGRPQKSPWALRPSKDATVDAGGMFIVYLAVAFERYRSEATRTYKVRDHSFSSPDMEKVSRLYGQLTACLTRGKPVSRFYDEAMGEIQKSEMAFIPTYGMGHGIGLSMEEGPVLEEGSTDEIREGMCLTLRLELNDKTTGEVMIGNTLLVTGAGGEGLTINRGVLAKNHEP